MVKYRFYSMYFIIFHYINYKCRTIWGSYTSWVCFLYACWCMDSREFNKELSITAKRTMSVTMIIFQTCSSWSSESTDPRLKSILLIREQGVMIQSSAIPTPSKSPLRFTISTSNSKMSLFFPKRRFGPMYTDHCSLSLLE